MEKLLYSREKYGTMDNTMVLWKKQWHYIEDYEISEISIYEGKNMAYYQKL